MRDYDINKLDAMVEKTISEKVKHYYTDWKNYDRPKYMKFKGIDAIKSAILLVRECGTYIFSDIELAEKEAAKTIYEYFTTQEASNVYKIDFTKGTVRLIHKGNI